MDATLLNVFVSDDDDIWALVRENETCCPECVSLRCRGIQTSLVKKASFVSHEVQSRIELMGRYIIVDGLGLRVGICVVAKDNFIYFLGGERGVSAADAYRCDFSKNTWEKIADMNHPKIYAHGAVAQGKVFIASPPGDRIELYHQATNEWQDIAFTNSFYLTAFGRRV